MDNLRRRAQGENPVTLTLSSYSDNVAANATQYNNGGSKYVYVYADGKQINPLNCTITRTSGSGASYTRNSSYITFYSYANGNTTSSRSTVFNVSYKGGTALYTLTQNGDRVINYYTYGIQNVKAGMYSKVTYKYRSSDGYYADSHSRYIVCDVLIYSTTAYETGGNRVSGLTLVDTITNLTLLSETSSSNYHEWKYNQDIVPVDTSTYNKLWLFSESKVGNLNYIFLSNGYTPYRDFLGSENSNHLGYKFTSFDHYLDKHLIPNGDYYTATAEIMTGNCVSKSTTTKQVKITGSWESYPENGDRVAVYYIEFLN